MTDRQIQKPKTISRGALIDLLRSFTVLLLPVAVSAVVSMLRLLTEEQISSDGWDICCFVFLLLCWTGAVVCTRTRLLGCPLPKTGLVLAAMLTLSVCFYALAFAMEQEIFSFRPALWALGRLLGGPVSASADGLQAMLGVMDGTAAMLTGGVYLAIALAAAVPAGGKKKKTAGK